MDQKEIAKAFSAFEKEQGKNLVTPWMCFEAGTKAMQPEMEKLKEELIHLYKGMKAAGITFHNNYANINHLGIEKRLKELDL